MMIFGYLTLMEFYIHMVDKVCKLRDTYPRLRVTLLKDRSVTVELCQSSVLESTQLMLLWYVLKKLFWYWPIGSYLVTQGQHSRKAVTLKITQGNWWMKLSSLLLVSSENLNNLFLSCRYFTPTVIYTSSFVYDLNIFKWIWYILFEVGILGCQQPLRNAGNSLWMDLLCSM